MFLFLFGTGFPVDGESYIEFVQKTLKNAEKFAPLSAFGEVRYSFSGVFVILNSLTSSIIYIYHFAKLSEVNSVFFVKLLLHAFLLCTLSLLVDFLGNSP